MGEKLGVYGPYGAWLRANVYFAGRTIWADGAPAFLDRLGTNRASGARFRPYGDEIAATSNDREKFGTYTRDSYTGLDISPNRAYASSYGNFTSPDPSVDNVSYFSPLTWNAYAYTNGDPVNANDPSGLSAVTLPPVVPGINCSSAFIAYAGQAGETVQQLFDSDVGMLGIMSYFEQEGNGTATDQKLWASLDWTFVNQWNLSATQKKQFYGTANVPSSFAATVAGGSQVFSGGQLKSGFETQLMGTLTGSAGSPECQGLATSFDVAQGVVLANNGITIPGLTAVPDPVPGALQFGSNGAVPGHSSSFTQGTVSTLVDGINTWTFYSETYKSPPVIRKPPRTPPPGNGGALF